MLYFHCDLHNDWANCKVMIWVFPNQTLNFYTSTIKLIMMTDVFRSHYIWTIAILTKTKPQETSNQIKSLLLSHHHSTCALVSVILESVLQTVQKQFTNRQYILTDLYRRQCAEYTYIYSVHGVLLDILTDINTHYTPYVHILHYVHIYTHSNMQRCNRLYISNVSWMCIRITRFLVFVQCGRVVQLNWVKVKVQCMAYRKH